jgi:adenylate kinase
MRVALCGSPGTGKSTVAKLLPYSIIDINELVRDGLCLGLDSERECLEADMDGIMKRLEEINTSDIVILDGHFSHFFAKQAIVLRCNPQELRKRLEPRGYSEKKIRENLEAEAVDVILSEAVDVCDKVDEIDTTEKTPEQVAVLVLKVIRGEARFSPGQVDWLENFLKSNGFSEKSGSMAEPKE